MVYPGFVGFGGGVFQVLNGWSKAVLSGVAAFSLVCAMAQDNQWVTVQPTFNTPSQYPGATLSSYNGWASLKYNSRDQAVIAWRMVLDARRHNGIYANALTLWSVKGNRIDLLSASNFAGGTYDAAPSFTLMPEFATDTTPCPRHPYDAIAYADTTHAFYMLLGATPRIVHFEATPVSTPQEVWDAHAKDGLSTWKYSFAENKWHRIPENIRKFWPSPYYCGSCVPFHDNHLVHWKSGHKLLFVEGRGTHAAVMDLTRETWDTLSLLNSSPFDLTTSLTTWDSKRERLVFRAGDSVCYFDPAARRFFSLPNCGLDMDSTRPRYTGIAYVTSRDVYLAVGRDGTTRVFDPNTVTWSTVATGGIGLSAGEGNLQMEYDPSTDKVVLSTETSGNYGGHRTFAYRPSGAKTKSAIPSSRPQLKMVWVNHRSLRLRLQGLPYKGLQAQDKKADIALTLFDARGKGVAETTVRPERLETGWDWSLPNLDRGLYRLRAEAQGQEFASPLLLME